MAAEYTDTDKMAAYDTVQDSDISPPRIDEADCEKHGATSDSNPLPDLKRKLRSRHLQMIAIGVSVPPGTLTRC